MSNNELAKPAISASRRWRRRLTVPAAMAVGLTGVLAALPAAQAGAATALTKVTKNTGTIPTAGSPKVAATAKIAVIASAVDPANGDVAESNGNQVFLVVNATAEPATDFGIGTSGTLTKGDAYLLAGKGGAGWPTPLVDGTKAVTSDIGIPSLVSFDGNGNLVMAGKSTGRTYVSTVPATTGSYYGFTSMTAGGLYFLAGNSVPGKTVPAPGITLPTALTLVSINAGGGLAIGGVQNVVLGTTTALFYLNFTTSSQTPYGVTAAAGHSTQLAGGGTTTCHSGAQTAAVTGGLAIIGPRLYSDTAGNLYVSNSNGTCTWVLPKASGNLTVDGATTAVTVGTAYKFAGDGVAPFTTTPALGTSAVSTSVGAIDGVTVDKAGNVVLTLNAGTGTRTTINGVYVIANSTGHYYTQPMTAGDVYLIAGGSHQLLGSFTLPTTPGVDGNGNLFFTDQGAHDVYELTGGPGGVAHTPTATATTLGATPASPQKQGTSVKFTATVTPHAAGTVKFTAGATTLGTVPVTTTNGQAFVTETTLTVGTYTIHAAYTPTTPATFAGSSATLSYKITTATAPGTTTFATTPTTGKTVSTAGTETITQTIPASGAFKLTVNDHAVVQMTRPKVNGATESSHGTLTPAQVTTTRNTVPGWTVSGQVGTFSSGTHTFPGSDLGWTPAVISQTTPATGVHAGPVVAPGTLPGLTAASTWAKATAGAGIGTTRLGAKLTLVIPSTTPPGTYHATFTVSAI